MVVVTYFNTDRFHKFYALAGDLFVSCSILERVSMSSMQPDVMFERSMMCGQFSVLLVFLGTFFFRLSLKETELLNTKNMAQ